MRADSADDLSLARCASAGDESALAAIYGRYADVLFAFVCHRCSGSRADAEDLWHETWLAAVTSLASYRGQCGLFTWLATIARNKITDYFRRQSRRRTETFSDTPDEHLAMLAGREPLPDEVLARQDVRARVTEALGELPEEYRAALIARYADGADVDQVAALLGGSYKAAEALLSRARAAFRAAMMHRTDD